MSTTKSFVQTLELLIMEVNDELAIQNINMESYFKKLYILGSFLQTNGVNDSLLHNYAPLLQKLFAVSQEDYNDLLNATQSFSDKSVFNERVINAIKLALNSYQYSMKNATFRIKLQDTLLNAGQNRSYKDHFNNFIQDFEKVLLIMNMKNIINDLKGILTDIPAGKKEAVINLILEINAINDSHQDNIKSSAASVRGLYTNVIMQAKEDLSGQRHHIVLRALSRMLRLISYGITAGGLYIWENKKGKKAPAWKDVSNTEYRVMNMFAKENLIRF